MIEIEHESLNINKRMKKVKYIITENGCHEITSHSAHHKEGCPQLGFNREIKRAHRLVWELANGPIPKGFLVCHHCDNPKCINIDHLFLGTNKDNSDDKWNKGRAYMPRYRPRGEKCGMSKLTEEQVKEIIALKGKITTRKLGVAYGICSSHVSYIQNGKRWNHLRGDNR